MFDNAFNDVVANERPAPAVVSPYLTAPEAAAYLRTTVQGIYSLVKRGRVHPMPGRPGRLLFTRPALDRYLSGRRR
jgi:excisionase family DNA binding protein